MRIVDAFLDPILKDALEKVKSTNISEQHNKGVDMGENDTLLDHLVRHTDDPVVLHDEVLNIMIAGRDTMSYAYIEFSHAWLQPIFSPWNMRYAVKDTVFSNSDPTGKPLFIPAGSPVSYSVHCMHRRTDYWGPDAEEFDPDRFLDYRVQKYLTLNPFIFLPFNAGPRICLGQQFAYNEMSFFLIRLLQKFETISLDTDSQPPDTRPPAHWANCPGRKGVEKFWPKAHLTLYSAGGLWIKMTEAKL
ncbi:hypothetical protein EW026_g7836 [Hermanssonia centrifuga]|uniref:Cytochrome P450 n=1 Tax=Hermanssonia centrifuga TaxID=98765 RepID=A0A4S4K6H5_9APHY|nr:hypothetical protein EW026_g7836 [Hermanssonia centrifuga]